MSSPPLLVSTRPLADRPVTVPPTGYVAAVDTAWTVTVSVAVAAPAAFVAVTVYVAVAAAALGVPEMTPVVGFRISPAGKAGVTAYDATAPPVLVGAFATIAVPTT